MKYNTLGNSDLSISSVGLGSWAIGGNKGQWGWGEQSEKESIKAIHAAIDHGINWIDTAPAYGLGNAEIIIKKALNQINNKPLIFTKCGFNWHPKTGELILDLAPKSIIRQVEDSLKRLNVDCIDLYQIHRPGTLEQNLSAWQTLTMLKQQGKVRNIGVSNFSKEQMIPLHTASPITSNQPAYSLLERQIETKDLPWCLTKNIGNIAHSTMQNGLLAGKMSKQRLSQMDKNDWRLKGHHFQEPQFSKNLSFIDFLSKMAKDKDCTVAQLSIAWSINNPAITAAIIGARSADQLLDLLPACEIKLTEKETHCINQELIKLNIAT